MAVKSDRLTKLQQQHARIAAQIADIERRKKAESRKEDTRLKIIVGATFIADMKAGKTPPSLVRDVLNRGLTTERDRELVKKAGLL
jgi:hypothetical protein